MIICEIVEEQQKNLSYIANKNILPLSLQFQERGNRMLFIAEFYKVSQ